MTTNARVQLRGGLAANRPNTGLLEREQLFTTDRHTLDVALTSTSRVPVVPEIDALTTMGTVTVANDLLIIHDADASGVKEKKITVDALKNALELAAGTTDEKVAIVEGGTAGYLFGSGSNGVLRMGPSMQWEKDASDNYVTLNVAVIDCGTF